MKKRAPALLSEEDLALWRAVAKTVTPRLGSHLAAARDLAASAPSPALPPPAPLPIKPALVRPPSLAPLERRLIQRLARGRLAADVVLDLHGLRQHEAFVVLRDFLGRAQRDGAKLVLVVTGKGSGMPDEAGERQPGVLRRAVPHWLAAPELRGLVVGFEQATRSHGGAGALYVRLRRHGRPRDDDAR